MTITHSLELQGIESITKVYVHNAVEPERKRAVETPDGGLMQPAEWILETDGTALAKVHSHHFSGWKEVVGLRLISRPHVSREGICVAFNVHPIVLK